MEPLSSDSVSSTTKPHIAVTVVVGRIFTVSHPSYRVLARSVGYTGATYAGTGDARRRDPARAT